MVEKEDFLRLNELDEQFEAMIKLPVKNVPQGDLFSAITPKSYDGNESKKIYIDECTQWPALIGEDIIKIKTLTGKRRDNAMSALYDATLEMFKRADPACFYIRGNVPSSKNSKDIITVNRMTKKGMQEFSVPVPSATVKKYIKESKGEWLQNKVAFLNQVRHLPLPVTLEFTFIRDSLRRFDFINAAQVLCDLMGGKNGYGYLPDDDSTNVVPVFNKIVYYHPKMAGVLIRVII